MVDLVEETFNVGDIVLYYSHSLAAEVTCEIQEIYRHHKSTRYMLNVLGHDLYASALPGALTLLSNKDDFKVPTLKDLESLSGE